MENNIKINKRGEKFLNFMKKYGYYILAALVIVAITLAVVLSTTSRGTDLNIDTQEPSEPVNAYALTFDLPLADCSVVTNHILDDVIYNESTGWFETHHGLDLVSETSSDVLAAAEGTVEEVYTSESEGTVVVIKHNDVYTSKYASLSDVTVKVGDTVTRGQKIGITSTSASYEVKTGAHLHFQLFMDENEVNPADYLNIEEK